MLQVVRVIPLLLLIAGTHGYCTFSGTKMQCTDSLSGKQVTLEIQVKACRRPVRIDIKLDMLDQTFRKKLDGSQDIPLPGLSIGGFGIVLNVFADPYDNGDLYLRVGLEAEVGGLDWEKSFPSLTILSERIYNTHCNVFFLWWNTQSPAVLVAVVGSAGLLLILLIICCCCCCCRRRASRKAVVSTDPELTMPTDIPLQNPAANQFKYKKQVDEIA